MLKLINPNRPFEGRTVATLFALCLALSVRCAFADSTALQLRSPKDGDHFEVTKPLLFWDAFPEANHYEIYIDDAKVAEAPRAAGPVLNYGLTTPLAPGAHHWYIKSISTKGDAVSSQPSTFTVDPPGHWPAWTIGPFVRYGGNPILKPQGTSWESVNSLSPGVIFDGRFRMLYRAQAKAWTSREGYAQSVDGVTFVRNAEPAIDATEPFEKSYGCEDARLFKYQGTYYAFYTGNDAAKHIALCEATSTDAVTWKKLGVVIENTKNGAVICDPSGTPLKINGKFVMYTGNSNFQISYSEDMLTWSPTTKFDMHLPKNWVTPYEPCVAVCDPASAHPDDVVLFIAGTLNGKGKWFYAISEVLFSRTDLTKKVDQLDDCILKPSEPYDSGQQKNSLWTNCIIQHNGQWMLYFCAGDRFTALATAPVR